MIRSKLLAEAIRFHEKRIVKHFIVWTERDNLPARRLNEAAAGDSP